MPPLPNDRHRIDGGPCQNEGMGPQANLGERRLLFAASATLLIAMAAAGVATASGSSLNKVGERYARGFSDEARRGTEEGSEVLVIPANHAENFLLLDWFVSSHARSSRSRNLH